MFEDETIDVSCPGCGRLNSILVRDFEESAEIRFVCAHCKAGVKVEGKEFQRRLERLRDELNNLQARAQRQSGRKARRPLKGDFQI